MRQVDASAATTKQGPGPRAGCCGSIPGDLQMGRYPQHLLVLVQEGKSGWGPRLTLLYNMAGVLGKCRQFWHAGQISNEVPVQGGKKQQ